VAARRHRASGGDLYMLSAGDVNEDSSGFRPLLFDRQDVPLVVNRFCDAYNEV